MSTGKDYLDVGLSVAQRYTAGVIPDKVRGEMQSLRDQGMAIDRIARRVGLNRQEVLKYTKSRLINDPEEGPDIVNVDETKSGKDTANKPRLSLVPPGIIEAVGEVRTFGTEKYGCPDNWKTVEPEFYVDALMRHMVQYLRDPKAVDEESGLSHLAHMATNIAFLIEMEADVNA